MKSKQNAFDICLCSCYLPPKSSNRHIQAEKYFENLLCDVSKYQNEGLLCISGDFNARCGESADFIEGIDEVPLRNFTDYTENSHGDSLIKFLQDSNMCMLNGRIGDKGQYTCVSSKGKSVVDYACVPYEQLHYWDNFKCVLMSEVIDQHQIHPPVSIPDHSILTCNVLLPTGQKTDIDSSLPDRKVFNITNIPQTFMNQTNESVASKILSIEQKIKDTEEIDNIYNEFENLLCTEMDTHLDFKMHHSQTHSHQNVKSKYKPYWNEELQRLWDIAYSKEKIWLSFKGNGSKRGALKSEFCAAKKSFSRSLRRYKRQHQRNEQLELLNLSDNTPQMFWKRFSKIGISNQRKSYIPNQVLSKEGIVVNEQDMILKHWQTSFESLYSEGEVEYDDQHLQNIIASNSLTEKNLDHDIPELNGPITMKEVQNAVIHAKLRKAAGVDNNKAEIFEERCKY